MGRRVEPQLLRDRHSDAVDDEVLARDEEVRSKAGVARGVGDGYADPGVLSHRLIDRSADRGRGDYSRVGGEVGVDGDEGEDRYDRPLRGLEDGTFDECLHQSGLLADADGHQQRDHRAERGEVKEYVLEIKEEETDIFFVEQALGFDGDRFRRRALRYLCI